MEMSYSVFNQMFYQCLIYAKGETIQFMSSATRKEPHIVFTIAFIALLWALQCETERLSIISGKCLRDIAIAECQIIQTHLARQTRQMSKCDW